jgi:hypothetical protein
VSKHTTCGDVDEDEVKRLVKVPGCRCLHRDVDVDAVLLGTNKARQKPKPEHTSEFPKFWGKKDSQKLSKFVSRERRIFMSKGQMDVKRGNYGVKTGTKCCQHGAGGCIPALAVLGSGYFWSLL